MKYVIAPIMAATMLLMASACRTTTNNSIAVSASSASPAHPASPELPEFPASPAPISVIFETDMGNDVDDALALDMIYKYVDAGKINLLGISTNKPGMPSAEYIDLMATWYGYADVPLASIGADGAFCDEVISYTQKVCEMTDSLTGKPLFERTRSSFEPSVTMYRRLLAAQPDSSVTVISVGFATNLAALLASEPDALSQLTGHELVARKVRRLVMMGGNFAAESPEYNIVRDIDAARAVISQWPGEIVTSPFELGVQVHYPMASIVDDFKWATPAHPMVEAYVRYIPGPYNRECWDLTSVLYAVEGEVGFNVSPPGVITINEAGVTRFTPQDGGKHRYLGVDKAQAKEMEKRLVHLIGGTRPARYRQAKP